MGRNASSVGSGVLASGVLASGVLAVVGVVVLVAGCASASAGPANGPASAGSRPSTSTAPAVVPALPAGTVGVPAGRGLMLNVSAEGAVTSVRGYDRAGHQLVRTVQLPGRYGLPRPVPSGPTEGLAHDGGVVVLAADPGAATSRFAVLGTALDAPAVVVDLPKTFSYDALSPDGSTLYLIEHLGPAGSQHYQVRAYDLKAQRLDDAVVVDKANLGEAMAGAPTSRVTSADGTVVATLYERVGDAPFVHVLQTVDRSARCVDLPAATRGARLAGAGNVLSVLDAAGIVRATVDVTTGDTAGPAAACASQVSRAALPEWARAGFTGDGSGLAHVVSSDGGMIAGLFGYPLAASPDPTVKVKVLWIPRPVPQRSPGQPSPGQPSADSPSSPAGPAVGDHALRIEGVLAGSSVTMTRVLPDGPGPSGVNFPQAGCWNLTLRWSGRSYQVVLPVG